MQAHFALDHLHGLVARIDVKLAPIFAPAREENQGVGVLPEHAYALAGLDEFAPALEQIDYRHGKHRRFPSGKKNLLSLACSEGEMTAMVEVMNIGQFHSSQTLCFLCRHDENDAVRGGSLIPSMALKVGRGRVG